MKRATRVYIAGPYTLGDPVINTATAMEIGHRLIECGYAPFVPHLSLFMHLLKPLSWRQWLAYDEEWVRASDALLRLAGESSGADREVAFAQSLGIPVFFTVESLVAKLGPELDV